MKYLVLFSAIALFSYFYLNFLRIETPSYKDLSYNAPTDQIRKWSQPVIDRAISTFSKSLQFETVYYETNTSEFKKFCAHLKSSFPLVHQKLSLELVGSMDSLLYTWKVGSNKDPVLFTAHYDVVPAPNPEQWTSPPFSGAIKDGYVYGRGALDYKVGVLAQLEAVEDLLRRGFVPDRTIYLAYGADEERGGFQGAWEITKLLEKRGVTLEMVQDEGGMITVGQFPTISSPIALVSTCEKGFFNLELKIECEPGHASMPSQYGCIGRLADAIKVIESNPPSNFNFIHF